jgi:hypothetical protein
LKLKFSRLVVSLLEREKNSLKQEKRLGKNFYLPVFFGCCGGASIGTV